MTVFIPVLHFPYNYLNKYFTLSTCTPSFAVCFVTSRFPIISGTEFRAAFILKTQISSFSPISYSIVIKTPPSPFRPLIKCPFPRPPAKIWAFTTNSTFPGNLYSFLFEKMENSPNSLSFSAASSLFVATTNFWTLQPCLKGKFGERKGRNSLG